MAQALQLKTPGVMTNPDRRTPNLLFAREDLLIDFQSHRLLADHADGAPTGPIVSEGHAELLKRSFGQNGSWQFPAVDLDGTPAGRPCMVMNKDHQISNVNGQGVLPNPWPQPLTYITVAKVNAFSNNTRARIIGGTTDYLANMRPSDNIDGVIAYSAGVEVSWTQPDPLGWNVSIMVANGVNSKIKAGTRPTTTVNLGTNSNGALHIGGNGNTTSDSGKGLDGSVADVFVFATAFSDYEIEMYYEYLARTHGIS